LSAGLATIGSYAFGGGPAYLQAHAGNAAQPREELARLGFVGDEVSVDVRLQLLVAVIKPEPQCFIVGIAPHGVIHTAEQHTLPRVAVRDVQRRLAVRVDTKASATRPSGT